MADWCNFDWFWVPSLKLSWAIRRSALISCRCVILRPTNYWQFTLLRLSQIAVFADALFFVMRAVGLQSYHFYHNVSYFSHHYPCANRKRRKLGDSWLATEVESHRKNHVPLNSLCLRAILMLLMKSIGDPKVTLHQWNIRFAYHSAYWTTAF